MKSYDKMRRLMNRALERGNYIGMLDHDVYLIRYQKFDYIFSVKGCLITLFPTRKNSYIGDRKMARCKDSYLSKESDYYFGVDDDDDFYSMQSSDCIEGF